MSSYKPSQRIIYPDDWSQSQITVAEEVRHQLLIEMAMNDTIELGSVSLNDSDYEQHANTPQLPLESSPIPINPVLNSLTKAFDDEYTTDFKFIVEGKAIRVHKTILRIRCEHFRSMFGTNWNESNKSELEMTQYSYSVYYSFLRYLYTGELSIAAQEAIGLLDLANSYCEADLKERAEQLLINGITIDNVAKTYSDAIMFSAKALEDCCFELALANTTAVVQTEGFKNLDQPILTKFISEAAFKGAFKH